jgi:hypothetical protein
MMRVPNGRHSLHLPDGIRGKLIRFRRRVWAVKLAEGVLGGLLGLLLSFLFVFGLDRLGDTPAWLRMFLLAAGATGLAVWLPLQWHRWIWRCRRLDQVARLVGRRFPRLGDQLLGIVELVQSDLDPGRSEALCRAALNQVDREAHQHDFADAVPHPRHRWWAWAASVPLAAALAALLLAPAAGSNALIRWLLPWRPTERYTFTQLQAVPRQMVVPYAEPFSVIASLSKFTVWSPPYASARYGRQEEIPAKLASHAYIFAVPPQKEADWLHVSVGDARRVIRVRPTTRPELTSMTARIDLPEYLQHGTTLTKDVRGGAISVLRGSRVTFVATATRPLAKAAMDGIPQRSIEGRRLVTSPLTVTESRGHQFTWQDQLGLSAQQPFEVSVTVAEDQAPTIACQHLSRDPVILDTEVLSLQVLARDDFGVRKVGLQWEGIEATVDRPRPAQGEKLVARGGPDQRQLEVTATFSARADGVAPQALTLRAFTVDYLPGRQRVYSAPYTVQVLSSEDHAIWLTRQFGEWFQQAQEVYEQEQRLHVTNEQLRSLSPQQLDLAENRRRIQTQAQAERDSARRLETVTSAGQQLVAQAVRNEQFTAATLETWAQMLQDLRAIARSQMPTVADLLQNAAQAPRGTPGVATGSQPADSTAPRRAPQVGVNRDAGSAEGPGATPTQPDPAPAIVDVESGVHDPTENRSPGQSGSQATAAGPGLPTTVVPGQRRDASSRPPSAPQQKLKEATDLQQDLLTEFARAAEELQRILNSLEGSTFVKRLKAAARRQTAVAQDLNQNLLTGFGLGQEELDKQSRQLLATVAERETTYSDQLYAIQSDLEAYYHRVEQEKLKSVLDQMKQLQVVSRLREIARLANENLPGQSIAQADFWADTLDRWAEELVGPEQPSGDTSPGSPSGSLPPSTILEVMRILEAEIDLREQTRALQQARPALAGDPYGAQAKPLADIQANLSQRVTQVTESIRQLPDGEQTFGQDVAVLARVAQAMDEAHGLLSRPETGAETIAAETEAIELLLQARRAQSVGGGGGGGSSPGAGGSGDSQQPALALLDIGPSRDVDVAPREVDQATGVTGAELPAEYRRGLDAYFEALEGSRSLRGPEM